MKPVPMLTDPPLTVVLPVTVNVGSTATAGPDAPVYCWCRA